MGYLGNHLATVVTGVFAAILTALWPYFVGFAPVLDFVFIMAVPIMWFLVLTCWIAQKSADYMHSNQQHELHTTVDTTEEKKSLTSENNTPDSSTSVATTTTTTTITTKDEIANLQSVQKEMTADLDGLKNTLKLKDSEIDRLNRQIASLQTRVQIETLRAELANLKMLASKQK